MYFVSNETVVGKEKIFGYIFGEESSLVGGVYWGSSLTRNLLGDSEGTKHQTDDNFLSFKKYWRTIVV